MQGVTSGYIAYLTLLRTPAVAEQILPFCVLFGTMAAFIDLTRKLELIVARSAGVSVWQFLLPPVAIALTDRDFLGRRLQSALGADETARRRHRSAAFWPRRYGSGRRHACGFARAASMARRFCAPKARLQAAPELQSVIAYVYEPDGKFEERVQAASATLQPGVWKLQNAEISRARPGSAQGRRLPSGDGRVVGRSRRDFLTPGLGPVLGVAADAQRKRSGRPRSRRLGPAISNASGAAPDAGRDGSDRWGLFIKIFPIWWYLKMVGGGIAAGFVLYLATKDGVRFRRSRHFERVCCRMVTSGGRQHARRSGSPQSGGWLMGRRICPTDFAPAQPRGRVTTRRRPSGARGLLLALFALASACLGFNPADPGRGAGRRERRRASAKATRQNVRRGRSARLRQGQEHGFRRRQRPDLLPGAHAPSRQSHLRSQSGRVYATGHAKMINKDGNIIYGDVIDMTKDFREGFVESLRSTTTAKTYLQRAARRDHARRDLGLQQGHLYGLRRLRR